MRFYVGILGLFLSGCNVAGEGVAEAAAGDVSAATKKLRDKTKSEGDADVTNVYARKETNGTWTFHVSVNHGDVGLDDFADGWDIVTTDGDVVKLEPNHRFTKSLRAPHVDEQPFTRTRRGLEIPDGIEKVRVRAHDSNGGFGGKEVVVNLSKRFGAGFTVLRKN